MTTSTQPTLKFLFTHPAHFLALGCGSGLSPIVPGTAGTAWGWATFLILQQWLGFNPVYWSALIAVSLLVGWWACTVTAQHMQVADPGSVVWDEIVAFWLVLWLIGPTDFAGQLAAFVLFRLFDIIKPGPIGWADKAFKGLNARGGFGILFDDILAALATVLVMVLWRML